MAAITTHQEQPDESSEEERFFFNVDDKVSAPLADLMISQSHAKLTNEMWIRSVIVEELRGRTITVQFGSASGSNKREVFLVLDQPIGMVPAWNPIANPNIRNTKLLSWTSKMGAPSFSLPAGSPTVGGACPGAQAGQSVIDARARAEAAKRLLPVLGVNDVRLSSAVCQHCYATGGQYSTGNVQMFQMITYAWTRWAVANRSFAPVMIDAINGANFRLGGEPSRHPLARTERFFRIHDSGDFFSPAYLEAWKEIADAFHWDLEARRRIASKYGRPDWANNTPTTFWAPSRMWALGPEYVALVSEINGPAKQSNLVIRPSAYHVNEHAPPRSKYDWSGWAGGTTVYAPDQKEKVSYDWDCRAYQNEDTKKTCRNSVRPELRGGKLVEGETGCRACWVLPEAVVNYTLH